MLSTVPPSIPSPVQPRCRGGQPANHNALKHGLHARQHPGPFAPHTFAVPASQPALFADSEFFIHILLTLRLQIDTLLQASQKATGLRSILSWHRLILHGITLLKQIMQARQRCLQPQQHLQFIAAHALDLIRYDFTSSGITRDAYSFRGKCELSDLNSPASPQDIFLPSSAFPHLFLTPHQCQVLAPLLPSSPLSKSAGFGEGLGEGLSRGRPPASPLPLLDALFWKIALHARWQDLPAGSPPMLTCRRYYRRLFLSGRLLTLYSALYQDLLMRGQTDLAALVNQGCFSLAGNQVTLQPGHPKTWQVRTALLFLQVACQVSIRILRKTDRSHRSLFPLPPSSFFSFPPDP